MNGSAVRNTGINSSKGDYIAFWDDGDYFNNGHMLRCVVDVNLDRSGVVLKVKALPMVKKY